MAQNICERKVSMKKYAIPGVMLIAGNQIISIIALTTALIMFLADVVNEAERKRGY